MMGPLFWKLLTAACLLWYGTITVYVTFRGIHDIRGMLGRLKKPSGNEGGGSDL